MKRIKLIFAALTISVAAANAQQTVGTIIYERSLNTQSGFESLPEDIRNAIQEQKIRKVLYFNSDASLFQDDLNKETAAATGDIQVSFAGSSEEKIFVDLKNKEQVAQRDILGKLFLVTEPLENSKWKTSGRQKKILDLDCMEAYYVGESDPGDTTFAWFTTAIPVQSGPEGIGGLPGMILELTIGKGAINYTAVNIAADDNQKLLKAPAKGKKVSREAFTKIQNEKMGIQQNDGEGVKVMMIGG